MSRIDAGHYQCPACKGVFLIGDMPRNKSGKKAGEVINYCARCKKSKETVMRIAREQLQPAIIEANKQADARRRLEDLREQHELERL